MLTYNNGNNSPEALPTDRKSPILDMLTDALDDEYSDYTKYMELSEKIDDTRDSGTVRSMAYDEYKHRRLFEEIYNRVGARRKKYVRRDGRRRPVSKS